MKINKNIKVGDTDFKINEKNYAMIFYQNTTTVGIHWTYMKFNASSGFASGDKISYADSEITINNAKSVKISVKMTIADNSYNLRNDVIVKVNNNYYDFRFEKERDYNIADFIVRSDQAQDWLISLNKYTNVDGDMLITSDTLNYMSVEVIE